MINNRPKFLSNFKYFKSIPTEFQIDFGLLPSLLNADLMFLNKSCHPYTVEIDKIISSNFDYENKLKSFYNRNDVKFQMINIVANIYSFIEVDQVNTAVPYSITLMPAIKRGKPQFVAPELAMIFQNSKLLDEKNNYTHFDPFKGSFGLWSSHFTGLSEGDYTDELGLVIGTYFLGSRIDDSQIILPSPYDRNEFTQKKFLNHRAKKYFTPLLIEKPRKIWGADSPIELFLLQGLAMHGLYPEIQTLIFEDGKIYPNYYEMVNNDNWVKGRLIKTELDLYFPKEKIAIFCDSTFHRSNKKKESAKTINNFLENLGINILRFESKDIINNLENCVNTAITRLKGQS